jgi:hypothetical protein
VTLRPDDGGSTDLLKHSATTQKTAIFIATAMETSSHKTVVSRSFALKESCRLRVLENMVLTRIFELKDDGVSGVWRKLHDEYRYYFIFTGYC